MSLEDRVGGDYDCAQPIVALKLSERLYNLAFVAGFEDLSPGGRWPESDLVNHTCGIRINQQADLTCCKIMTRWRSVGTGQMIKALGIMSEGLQGNAAVKHSGDCAWKRSDCSSNKRQERFGRILRCSNRRRDATDRHDHSHIRIAIKRPYRISERFLVISPVVQGSSGIAPAVIVHASSEISFESGAAILYGRNDSNTRRS